MKQLGLEGNERILFVDDEESIVVLAKKAMERFGYRVTVCCSAIDALNIYKQRPEDFDIVITDLAMPKMSGLELTEQIRHISTEIPVIICTGFGEGITEENASQLGIRKFLWKPVVARELAETVRIIMDEEGNSALQDG